MNPWHVILGLYESEINSGMESDCSGGITAWIAADGARMAQRTFPPDEFGEIADWLDLEARRREELNGLYVAMSRARERLVFSATEPHRPSASTFAPSLH